ncbi:putative cysteine-rich repeat secretory protein 22 [Platanthera guangdongensis]|uniref:Cysteine-rich repeat secretory protein 22 n=1 Tax=Platanthera guangdongensis TaxID=2320717 RepID=A0ABR2MBL6_9ASPA
MECVAARFPGCVVGGRSAARLAAVRGTCGHATKGSHDLAAEAGRAFFHEELINASSSPLFLLSFLFLPFLCYSLNETTPFLTYCSGDNFTSPSLYESDLRRLLSFLIASTPFSSSYYAISTFPNSSSPQIFGLAQCRPDSTVSLCSSCLNQSASMAASDSTGGCGNRKSAALRYDLCLLRYSDQSFFGAVENRIFVYSGWDANNASLILRLEIENLVRDSLIEQAVSTREKFAMGYTSLINGSGKIYGMVWCSMDLEGSDCRKCLGADMDGMVPGKEKGRAAVVSCEVRFDPVQFFSLVFFPGRRKGPPPKPRETVARSRPPVREEGEFN